MSDSHSISQKMVKEIFDYKDGELVWKQPKKKTQIGEIAGCIGSKGYRLIGYKGKVYKAHRLVFLWHNGYLPVTVDHINRNRSDNRIENLRAAEIIENAKNLSVMQTNTSGVTGVYWQKNAGKWRAMIQQNKNLLCLGLFEKIEDAIATRKKAEKEIYGEFAPL